MNAPRRTRQNILVLGSSGMLGSVVFRTLQERSEWQVTGTQAHDPMAPGYLDILKVSKEQWGSALVQRPYDYVVNCIGILKTEVNESEAGSIRNAILVNSLFPHQLSEVLPTARIIHVSTDGVFSGRASKPYVETDATDCSDVYGKSKALGECPAHNVLNIRCSIIGRNRRKRKGLIEWILQSPPHSELPGYENQVWNGVSTKQFAQLCKRILESESFDQIRAVSHLHHFCPNSTVTKYDLLCMVRELSGAKLSIRKTLSESTGRVLGSMFGELHRFYPDSIDWLPVLKEMLEEA